MPTEIPWSLILFGVTTLVASVVLVTMLTRRE
jgi:hypothetical protein